ncbi:eukaryotic translation initiation factor 4Bb isoform X2 [Pangasianodon hypophthalmus]|uniref:eukaryotic translation initiation factor 4Bb isoform X2 n=1 Tax=Pangasianodon hypophthalmus TaxID=310915 RepID=UPI0023079131|nr:eukaryotic translation initiation factor 4Bb isoform X2 [Pangasianodon hypophthalmus]
MCTYAKKNKKKGKTLTLTDFLAEDSGGSGPPAYPAAKATSWADETEDLDGEVSTSWHTPEDSYRAPPIDRSILPTAPRAAREPNVDRSRLPRSPPYTAFLGNLPYDVTEESIKQFFRGLAISAVRLPREPSNPERLKGFGYAEFDDVDSLLRALTLNEENLGNRRIRVDIADQSNDKERDGGLMSGRDRDRDRGRGGDGGPDKTDSDWRARPSVEQDDGPRRDDGFGERSRDRYESDRYRDGPRRDDRYGGRDRYDDRERYDDRDRRDRYDDRGGRDFDRGGYDSRGGGRRAFGSGYRRDYDDRRDGDRYGDDRYERRDDRREERAPPQRPRLNLKPRSVPKEEEQSGGSSPQPNPGRSASIFGAAKPVDTAAKEREVEERLKKEQERLQRQLEEDKPRPSERRPRDRDPSWRSEATTGEHERTASESTHHGGSKHHESEHSENEVDEPTSPGSRPPVSPSQGALPLKVMPAPPPKENAWAKRSAGGGANTAPSSAPGSGGGGGGGGGTAHKSSSSSNLDECVSGKDENQLDGVGREKGVSQGRGGGALRGGGRGRGGDRGGDGPNKDRRREPTDKKESRREREPRPAPEPKKYEETEAPVSPKFSSASKYAALLMDGEQAEEEDAED